MARESGGNPSRHQRSTVMQYGCPLCQQRRGQEGSKEGGKGTDEKLIELGPVVVHDSGVLMVKATAEDAAAATKARVNFMTGRELRVVKLRE